MQSEKNLRKKREERGRGSRKKRQEQSVRVNRGDRHRGSQAEERRKEEWAKRDDWGLGSASFGGKGTWGFIYYPARTEPGASFTGFWLRDE